MHVELRYQAQRSRETQSRPVSTLVSYGDAPQPVGVMAEWRAAATMSPPNRRKPISLVRPVTFDLSGVRGAAVANPGSLWAAGIFL